MRNMSNAPLPRRCAGAEGRAAGQVRRRARLLCGGAEGRSVRSDAHHDGGGWAAVVGWRGWGCSAGMGGGACALTHVGAPTSPKPPSCCAGHPHRHEAPARGQHQAQHGVQPQPCHHDHLLRRHALGYVAAPCRAWHHRRYQACRWRSLVTGWYLMRQPRAPVPIAHPNPICTLTPPAPPCSRRPQRLRLRHDALWQDQLCRPGGQRACQGLQGGGCGTQGDDQHQQVAAGARQGQGRLREAGLSTSMQFVGLM